MQKGFVPQIKMRGPHESTQSWHTIHDSRGKVYVYATCARAQDIADSCYPNTEGHQTRSRPCEINDDNAVVVDGNVVGFAWEAGVAE